MRVLKSINLDLRLMSVCLLGACISLSMIFYEAPSNIAHAQGGKNPRMAIKLNDKNGDGKVSRSEWRKSASIFDEIDTDGDGYLTVKEFKARFSGGKKQNGTISKGFTAKESPDTKKVTARTRGKWYGDADYWQGPIIDIHSQVDEKTNLDEIVPLLDRAGVAQVVLSTRFGQPTGDILALAKQYPDRIVPAAKTKTKAFMKGRDAFPGDFYNELKRFNFRAMAEIIIWHAAKKGVGAGKATMAPDDPRIGPLLKTARGIGCPFIAHVEFGDMEFYKAYYMKKFEAFLSANQDIPIGMIHMGQLKVKDAKRLLPMYPNLFFITSHCNPVTTKSSKLPWTRMFKGEQLTPAWEDLVLRFPDRFVLAFDNVFHFHWKGTFIPQVLVWRKALRKLPDEVANALAHGNAERLWKLPPAGLQ